jgi:hypothetical protein
MDYNTNINTIVIMLSAGGTIILLCFGVIGYFLNRMFTKNDENFKELFIKHNELTNTLIAQNGEVKIVANELKLRTETNEREFLQIHKELQRIG